jgi:hypothetical protein
VKEVPDRETHRDQRPEAAPRVASGPVPIVAVSLAALAVIGAATANSLPNFQGFSLPDFSQISLLDVDRLSLPDFSRFTPPSFHRVAAPPPPPPPPVLVPDPVVRAGLRDIQTSQQENADALASVLVALTQNSATQQADLKKITRQLAVLSAQVNSLQNPATLTTSSIPPPAAPSILPQATPSILPSAIPSILPPMTSSIPRPIPRGRVVHASRKVIAPALSPVVPPVLPATLAPLPKPAGPVSVGGAPLIPAPGSDAS